jgi:hypothetical protein
MAAILGVGRGEYQDGGNDSKFDIQHFVEV